ncbi:MAG: PAS domain S-box protein, partial [Anaerolineales bacterium]
MSEQDLNEERLELALEAAGLDLWENNLVTGKVIRKAAKTLCELGYSDEEAAAYIDDIFKIIHPDDIPRLNAAVNDHLTGVKAQYRCEFRIRSKRGKWVWYANYGKIMDSANNQRGQRFIGVTFNIDDRKRREEELVVREQESRTLIENSPDTVARYDSNCRRIYVNPAFGAMSEGGVAALLGRKPSEYPGGANSDLYEEKINEVFASGNNSQFELKWIAKDGKELCSHIRLTAERNLSGHVTSVLGIGRDITELYESKGNLRRANAQLERVNELLQSQATSDPLTGLPNRRLMLDRLKHALASSMRNGREGALLFIDLDNFKTLNDTLG